MEAASVSPNFALGNHITDKRTILLTRNSLFYLYNTVKPVYNGHLGDEASAVVIDRWSL